MKDREKALDRIKRNKDDSDSDEASKRRDKYSSPNAVQDGKKKKRSKKRKKHSSDESSSSSSSSSSSEEDKTKSIRVAMRNKLLESDGKIDLLEKIRQGKKDDIPEDKLLSQWMTTANDTPGKDKQLLDNLKEKLKQKQDAEKAKIAYEAEVIRRQKEREEAERKERERFEKEAMVKEEEKKHREKMSLKLRQQPSIREYRFVIINIKKLNKKLIILNIIFSGVAVVQEVLKNVVVAHDRLHLHAEGIEMVVIMKIAVLVMIVIEEAEVEVVITIVDGVHAHNHMNHAGIETMTMIARTSPRGNIPVRSCLSSAVCPSSKTSNPSRGIAKISERYKRKIMTRRGKLVSSRGILLELLFLNLRLFVSHS